MTLHKEAQQGENKKPPGKGSGHLADLGAILLFRHRNEHAFSAGKVSAHQALTNRPAASLSLAPS